MSLLKLLELSPGLRAVVLDSGQHCAMDPQGQVYQGGRGEGMLFCCNLFHMSASRLYLWPQIPTAYGVRPSNLGVKATRV